MFRELGTYLQALKESTDIDIRMFILNQTYSKKPEKMYVIKKVNIGGGAKEIFKEILALNIEKLKTSVERGERRMRDFFDFNASSFDVFTILPDQVDAFPYILNQINQYSSLETLTNVSDIKRIKGYAIEVRPESNGRLIYFRKFSESKILSRKGFLPMVLYRGVFDSVKGDVFTIDGGVDCIYIENTQAGIIIVNNKGSFEDLFNFKEFYKLRAYDALTSLKASEIIEIPEEIIELASQKTRYARKITNLIKAAAFDETLREAFSTSKERLPGLKFEISNGKIRIQDEDGLKHFIDVWEDNLVESIARRRIYRALSKEEFEG